MKIFISALGFCCHNKLHKIKSDQISATSCCDKILLWRRSSQKFSSTHKAFFHCNVSHNLSPDLNTRSYLLLRCVTATCSPVYPNLWSPETQAQLPLLLTQSCCPPTFSYFWAWAIFQHLARWQALPFFLATLAWTWATPTLAQKPSGHVLANFERCISVVMPYQTDLARST